MADIYLAISETPTVVTLTSAVLTSAVASSVTVANTVTVALDANSLSALENVTVTVGAAITGTVTVSNFPASQAVTFSAVTISNFPSTQTIAGTVNVGNVIAGIQDGDGNTFGIDRTFPVTVDSLPSLPTGSNLIGQVQINGQITSNISAGTARIGVVTIGGGTVTIGAGTAQIGSVTASIIGTVPVSGTFWQTTQPVSLTSTTVTVNSLPSLAAGTNQIGSVTASISGTVPISISSVTVGNSVTIGSLPALAAGTAQIGSVTASISANPSGALTTRFGSVTTANTAQITTAVTNTSRKYLFAQNISIGSVTMGIGFSPTTTQGIQLSAGSGIVFDSFCPTGAVYWLGATTGAAWSILEG